MENEGTFVWESTHNMSRGVAAHWESGQPNGGSKENCVAVKNGEIWDVPCNKALRFVCQKRPQGMYNTN